MSDDFSIWDVFVSMFWFMLLFAWIMLLFHIIADIFRDRELSGFGKAMWCLFLIFIPWIGALTYLIVRGNSMAQRSVDAAKENEANMRAYVRDAAGTTSAADELAKLAQMRDSGAITPEDFEKAKAKVLA